MKRAQLGVLRALEILLIPSIYIYYRYINTSTNVHGTSFNIILYLYMHMNIHVHHVHNKTMQWQTMRHSMLIHIFSIWHSDAHASNILYISQCFPYKKKSISWHVSFILTAQPKFINSQHSCPLQQNACLTQTAKLSHPPSWHYLSKTKSSNTSFF